MSTKQPIFPMTRTATMLAGCLLVAGLGLSETSRAAQESPNPPDEALRIEANAFLVDHEGQKLLRVQAVLINQGTQDITVLTEVPEHGLGRDASGFAADFSFAGRERRKNGPVMIPSLYPLAPVTLRPGEATRLVTPFSGRMVESLDDGETIRVRYHVSEAWGERFNLWHGLVETEAAAKRVAAK